MSIKSHLFLCLMLSSQAIATTNKSSIPDSLKIMGSNANKASNLSKSSTKQNPRFKMWKAQLLSQFSNWGVNPQSKNASINLENSWRLASPQKSITVAVVDTGIEYDHPYLKDNLTTSEGNLSIINYGKDFSRKTVSNTPSDSHGHGTHVAGIVKTVFPDVKILALKYYNPKASGQANLEATIRALKYAVDQNVDIINYSGGGPEPSPEELKVLQEAESKGILIIAAAGNEKSNIDLRKNAYYPASYGLSNIVTVGAYDQSLRIIPSSNWGAKSVDIAAPGYRIRSSIPNKGKGFMTGTSQATAFVTGVAALIKSSFPEFNYAQVKNILLSSAPREKSLEGKVLGAGKLDATRAIMVADQVYKKIYGTRGRSVAKSK